MPSGRPPSSNSIIVGNCISCEGLVRVSAKTKANSDVRCPHCQETFSLAALLESAVPEVEIIEPESAATKKEDLYIDKTAPTSKDASGKFVVPSQLAKGARRRKSSRRSSSSNSSSRSSSRGRDSESSSRREDSRSSSHETRRSDSDRGSSEHAPANETSYQNSSADHYRNGTTSEPMNSSIESSERLDDDRLRERSEGSSGSSESRSHRSTRHRDMRATEAIDSEPNPVVTFLKVLMGGALALPIAYLIVMWVFARDPLGIGKQLGEKIPFVVPSSLKDSDDEDFDSNSDSDSTSDGSIPDFGGDSDSGLPNAIDSGFDRIKIGEKALEDFGN